MYRMLLLAVIAISLIKTSQCEITLPKMPVPNADALDELLSKFLGDSYSNNALSEYIMGAPGSTGDTAVAGENLDISILDADTIKKVINFAKNRYKEESTGPDARRSDDTLFKIEDNDKTFRYYIDYSVEKLLMLQAQIVYQVKEKINETRTYRKKYSGEYSYQIAVLYGASAALLSKIESLIGQMSKFPFQTHFIWYLMIYERVLACNTDIAYAIEKIFLLHAAYSIKRGAKDKKDSIFDLKDVQSGGNETKMPPHME